MTKTIKTTSLTAARLISLGYAIQTHRGIESKAREALSRLQHYSDKDAAIQEAQRVIHELMRDSIEAINFDIENAG